MQNSFSLLVVISSLLMVLSICMISAAQAIDWSCLINISKTRMNITNTAITVDHAGHVYLVWEEPDASFGVKDIHRLQSLLQQLSLRFSIYKHPWFAQMMSARLMIVII